MIRHGVTIIPHLLSETTATTLRNYIIEQNTIRNPEEMISVIEQEFRWSFPIQVDEHPIITTALQEILNNTMESNLMTYLEAVIGIDPAVTEFTAITQAYGAIEQRWHVDVVSSGSMAKYGRSFVPTYNLFIPLQNVTAEMGATSVCPGTHMCSESDFCSNTTGFQASGRNNHWPLGYGVFLHQQTTHRGGTHCDPHAPQRVLFILTMAPRSRVFAPNRIVETRKIGLEGSYSLHFSHWGHTLSDYQNPSKFMTQPYHTLRSLGIYNNRGNHHWGWDYMTVCTGRLGNDDFMQCPSPRELKRKLRKAKAGIVTLYQLYMIAYVGVSLLSALVRRWRQSTGKWSRPLMHEVSRLCFIHAAVLCVAGLMRQHVQKSTWGLNIQASRSFRVVSQKTNIISPATSIQPVTQPEDRDIIIFESMQSDSPNSYTRVLEVVHPGNTEWNSLIRLFAMKYDKLSVPLQEHIRRQLLNTVQAESRRILIQNSKLNWTPACPEICHRFAHKRLLQSSNHHMNFVIQNLEYIFGVVRYGYFRDTVLFQKHISQLLSTLRNQIMKPPWQRASGATLPLDAAKATGRQKYMFSMAQMRRRGPILQRRANVLYSGMPLFDPPKQSMASLIVGNVAEATFGDGEVLEWYRCTVTYANSNLGTWNVKYDDGEEGNDLCRYCVRPFIPYTMSETLDVLLEPDHYKPCHVISMHQSGNNLSSQTINSQTNDLMYDVLLDDDSDRLLTMIPMKDLRRNYRNLLTKIPIECRVMVRVQYDNDGDFMYEHGKILQHYSIFNSYDIRFAYGDVLSNVSRRHIKLI